MGRLTKEQIEFIKNNVDILTNQEMAEKLGCNKSTITNWRKKLNISFSDIHDFSKYNQYIIDNYYKKTSAALAKEIGCSKPYVTKVWRENNLKNKTTKKYYSNFSYFDNINTSNKAYLLGLICADGCIYQREGHEGLWQITLDINDIELLEQIKKEIESENPINIHEKTAVFTIVSQRMYNKLIGIGIIPKKTYEMDIKEVFNNIPQIYIKDFLRGYFDGDGTITVKEIPSRGRISFALPRRFKEAFQEALLIYGIESHWENDNRENKYTIPFGTLRIEGALNKYCLLKLFYFENGISMKRKKQLCQELCKQIQSNITNRSENITAVKKWEELLENLRR